MPSARQIVSRSPHRRAGRIACPWFQDTSIEYESLLERDFVRLALLDPLVSSVAHQPFILDLQELGSYIPDFLLCGTKGKLVVEVKPEKYAINSRHGPRLQRAEKRLRERDYRFMLATEKTIHDGRRHERAAVLLRHARSHLTDELRSHVLACATKFPRGVSIGDLASSAGVPTTAILHLVGRRLLKINNALHFDDSQLVFPIGGRNGDLYA